MLQTYYVINLLFEPIFVMPAHLQLITEYVHFEHQQNLIFLPFWKSEGLHDSKNKWI